MAFPAFTAKAKVFFPSIRTHLSSPLLVLHVAVHVLRFHVPSTLVHTVLEERQAALAFDHKPYQKKGPLTSLLSDYHFLELSEP